MQQLQKVKKKRKAERGGSRTKIKEVALTTRKIDWAGVSFDEFPKTAAWLEKLKARDAVKRGFAVPDANNADKANLTDAEREKIAADARAWVQSGMAADAKKQ